MRNITLVCSAHRENGLCNAEELLKILRAIGPQVIFEEFRPSEFDSHVEHGNVEANAIKKYREFKSFQQVEVDRFDMSEILDIEKQDIFAYVEYASQDYQALKQVLYEEAYRYGFEYLNSAICEKLMIRLCEIEEKTISESGDQDLIRGLERWRSLNLDREIEMVRNICEYSREYIFDTGIFVVGAAHKIGIVGVIEKHVTMEADLINWNLTYGQNP